MHRLKEIAVGDTVRVTVPVVAKVVEINRYSKPATITLQNECEGLFIVRLIDYLTINKLEVKNEQV